MDAAGGDDDVMPTFTHREARRVVIGILLCILLAAVDQTVVVPAVPAIAAEMNAFGHLSWIVTAYLLTSTAMTPIYGKISDSVGRRAVLLPCLVLFFVASAACALAQTLPQLIGARALQGVGGAGLMSMAQSAIADVVAPRERGRYQAYMTTTWGFASIAGPILGGYVTDHLSWRWVFWINLPITVAAFLLSDRALRMIPVRRRPVHIDWGGSLFLVAGITAWLLLLSWGGSEYAWLSWPILGLFTGGLALIWLLAWQERRSGDPLLPPRLFASRVFVCGIVLAFFASLGMFAGIFMLPLFFQLIHGADAEQSGQLVVPFLTISTVASYGTGVWTRRVGRTRLAILVGLVITAVGLGLMAGADGHTALWLTVLYSSLAGIGVGIVMPATLVSVQNAAERRDVGVATATMLFLRSMGGAFGSTMSGALVSMGFGGALATIGLEGRIDLGALRAGSDAFAGLPAGSRGVAEAGLQHGFSVAFAVAAGLMLVAVGVALVMPDVALRAAGEPTQGGIGH